MGACRRLRPRATSRIGALLLAVAVLAAAVGFSTAAAGDACACSCMQRPAAEVVSEAQAIVVGTPVARMSDGSETRYTFEVQRSYRAEVYRKITVSTASSSASCGVELTLNEPRALVLWGGEDIIDPGKWTAGLCDNLGIAPDQLELLGAGEAIEPLETPEPPPAGGSGSERVVGAVALAAVVVIGGAALLRWRRRRAD